MFDEKPMKNEGAVAADEPMTPIPLEQREKWVTPAVVFGGLEFSVSVLMIGATLIGAFGAERNDTGRIIYISGPYMGWKYNQWVYGSKNGFVILCYREAGVWR